MSEFFLRISVGLDKTGNLLSSIFTILIALKIINFKLLDNVGYSDICSLLVLMFLCGFTSSICEKIGEIK